MSEYQLFLQERDRIDSLIQKGYKIKKITENLSGAMVEFEKSESQSKETKRETLQIVTPNARKYFSVKLIQQRNEAGGA
jgi:broad-specificity NMP kinase